MYMIPLCMNTTNGMSQYFVRISLTLFIHIYFPRRSSLHTHRPFLFSTDFMLIYVQTWAYEGLVVRPTSELRVKVMTHHLEEAGPNGRPPGGQGLEVGRWGEQMGPTGIDSHHLHSTGGALLFLLLCKASSIIGFLSFVRLASQSNFSGFRNLQPLVIFSLCHFFLKIFLLILPTTTKWFVFSVPFLFNL